MASAYGNGSDDEDGVPVVARHQPGGQWANNAQAGSSRHRESSIGSSAAGSRSFLNRLENTLSPGRSRYASSDVDEVPGTEDLDLDGEEDEDEGNDVRRMGRIWVKERGTVDIMQWEGDLIDTLFDKLEQQAKMVNTLRMDPQTSEEEHFKLMLVQTEMERVKFLVRSYVRTRLHKIEKYAHHIVLTPALHSLLSGAELSHAERYCELLHTHFQHSILESLPEWLRRMDDRYGDGLSMVSKPNKSVPVLIYCRRDCGEITLEGGEAAQLGKGTTHLVKYKMVERWISLGWAEIL